LNPFYAANRYFYLETKTYWTSEAALKWDVDNFEKDLFVTYNCDNLRKEFEGDSSKENSLSSCTLKTVKDVDMFPVDKTVVSSVTSTPTDVEKKVYEPKRRADGVYLP
jgi:hypothetical protein